MWKVDDDLVRHARRFVDAFNALFDDELPTPHPDHAERYWRACYGNDVLGRCVRLGSDDTVMPHRYYHWAIRRGAGGAGGLEVHEFWDVEIWTTDMYRAKLGIAGANPGKHDVDPGGS